MRNDHPLSIQYHTVKDIHFVGGWLPLQFRNNGGGWVVEDRPYNLKRSASVCTCVIKSVFSELSVDCWRWSATIFEIVDGQLTILQDEQSGIYFFWSAVNSFFLFSFIANTCETSLLFSPLFLLFFLRNSGCMGHDERFDTS